MPSSTVSFLAVVQGHVPHYNLANCNFYMLVYMSVKLFSREGKNLGCENQD